MVTPSIYGAFILFHNIITKSALFPFYSFDDTYMKQRITIFKQILGYNLQELCFHFEDEGIQPSLYIYKWFMSLYAQTLNIDITCRVWDRIFLDGLQVLYRTAIAILAYLQDELIEMDFGEIMMTLGKCSDYITDENKFIKLLDEAVIPEWIGNVLPALEID